MASGLSLKSHGLDLNITLPLYLVPGVSPIILNGDAAAAHVDWSPGGIIDHGNVVDVGVVTQPVLGVSDGRGFPLDVNGVSCLHLDCQQVRG